MRVHLLDLLTHADEERARRVGAMYAIPLLRTLAELLIDLEEDPAAREIVVSELRIMNRQDS